MHTVHLPQHTTLFTVLRKPTIFVKALCLLLLVGFLGIEGVKGQTVPSAQSLPYTTPFFTSFSSGTTTTYPAGWGGHTVNASLTNSFSTSSPSADRTLVASGSQSNASNDIMNFTRKIGSLGGGSRVVAPILAVNTTGYSNVKIYYVIGTNRVAATGANAASDVQMQYRASTSNGTFTSSGGTIYTTASSATRTASGDTSSTARQAISVTLPAGASNQSVLQIRWATRSNTSTTSGSRSSWTMDTVSVTGTSQATSITTGSATLTSIPTISCTNGTGTSRAVFISASSTGAASPVDGTTYVATTDWNNKSNSGNQIGTSGWYCIYNGTGTPSVDVSNLASGTTYRIMVCEYDGSAGAEIYNAYSGGTNNPLNVTTVAATPTFGVSGTTAHGSICPNTSATKQTYTITNTGTDATGVVVSSNDPQFVVSNLSSSSIVASGTATYDVTFTPTSAGAKTATISVYYNTSTLATTSSLTGTGTATVSGAVTTSAASGITAQLATLNGNVTTLGVCPATIEKGFVYSITGTNNDPLVNGTGVTKTSVPTIATGAYTLALTGLPSSTSYSYKAYVYDGTTYTYGTAQTFTTSIAMVVSGTTGHGSVCPGSSTTPITYTITNNGNIAVSGINVSSSDAQFVVSSLSSTTIAAGGTATYVVTFTPSSAGAKSATISVSSTTSGIVTATSSLTGTGTATVTPVLSTSAASSVAGTTATLNGTFTTAGVCPATTQKGFVYSVTSTNATPTNGGTGVTTTSVPGVTTGAYTLGLTGLSTGTGYSFRSYVFDGSSYTYGSVLTFTTTTPPSNDDCSNATNITVDAAAISGTNVSATKSSPSTFTALSNYTSNTSPDVWYSFTASCTGNYVVTATPTTSFDIVIAAFSGGSCPNPTYTSYKDASGSGTTSAAESLTISATAGVTYRIMVFGYSATTGSFNIGVTGPTLVSQAVTTNAASSITALTTTLNGNVTALGNCPPTTEKGFVFALTSDNNNPQVGGLNVTKQSVSGVATGAYTLALSSLTPATGYTFNTYVYDGSTYTYGTATAFTTLSNPSLAVTGTTAHGSTCPNTAAATKTYTITNTGSDATNVVVSSSDAQFVVSNLSSTTIIAGGTATYDVVFTPTSAGAKTATISVYYSTSTLATTSSLTGTGTTPVTAAVTTSAVSSVVNTTATLNGNVTTLGVCPATIEKGFVYSVTTTNSNPIVNGTGVTKTSVSSIVTGAYTLSLTGLTPATGYTVKAYVYDGTSYTYGTAQTFTTLSVATKLAFGTAPATTAYLATNLASFTVQALRADNTVDPEYTGTITLTSTGTITGTTASLSAGTATFSTTQFTTSTGNFTITASLSPLTAVTSSSITVNPTPVVVYQNPFESGTLSSPSYTGGTTTLVTNLSNSVWRIASGTLQLFSGNGGGNALGVSSGTTSTPYTLTFDVANGYQLAITSYSFWKQTSSSAVVNSVTINGTTVSSGAATSATGSTGTLNVANPISGLTGTITVVLNITGSGSFRLDDFTLNGTVSQGPTATISNTSFTQFTTQSLARNTTNNLVSRFKVDVTNGTTVLSALSFNTPNNGVTNSYVGGTDLNNFKLWYGTTSTFASATQIGTTQTAANNNPTAGETVNFSSLATSLPIGTYYFWVSADILGTATSGKTITVNAPTLTLSTGTVAGNTTATGTQTFIAGASTNYYLNGSNASTAGSWFTGTAGTGTALSSLTATDVNLIVDDETNATINGDLTLGNNSKIIVSQGATAKLTIAGVGVTGTIDVGSAGTLVITSSTIPTLGTLATGSTVTYDLAGNQSSTSAASYGNVTLGGSGTKTLANTVSLTGTLTVPSGVTLDASNTVLSGSGSIDVQAGATLIVGNASGINGFNTTSGTSNFSTGANYTFNGTSSQVLGSSLPSTVNNLTISNGNQSLALNGSTTVNGALALSGGTKLAIGNSTLTLNGTFSGNASSALSGSTSSNLTIGGSGAFGTLFFDQTSNTTKTLNNLIINRTSSGTVSLGNSLRLAGELTPTAGVLTTGSNLRLLSSAIGTSAAIGIGSSSGGYISGTVDVERYSQAQRGYRTFAHPYTTAQSVSQFTDNFQVTGLTSGTLGTYGVGGSTNPSAFYYDGTKPAGNAYVLGRITKSDSLAWGVGKGLYVFVRGNGSEGTGGNYSSGISPVTLDVTNASINQGDVTVSLTPYSVGADNFTLVGNPYPCPINLSGVTGISSFGTIYLQNPTYSAGSTTSLRGGFEATSNKNIVIPSMGCFYIQSTASTPSTITFHESDKVGSGASSYAVFGTGTPKPTLGLEISTSVGFMDRTKLAFDANASSAATDFYDAGKLGNNLVTFYSLSSERKALGIDYRKTNTTEIIPLGIQTTVATNYTIKLSELTNLENTQVVLRDKFLKTETILSQVGDSYSFDITADTATKGENRFEIGLLGTTVLPVQLADITAQLQANKTVAVNWTSTSEVNLASYKVQRSKDGSTFSTVGTVAAKGASTYTYNDDLSTAGVLPSTIYYRLEAVDKDGSKTYSKVVSCQLSVASKSISIYPNPVQATLYAQVTVTKAGAAQLRVIDAQGKVVATQKTQLAIGTTSVSIPAAQLTAGNYVLEIDSADGKQTQRFVKE